MKYENEKYESEKYESRKCESEKYGSSKCESGYENLISIENLINHSSLKVDNLNVTYFISSHYKTC